MNTFQREIEKKFVVEQLNGSGFPEIVASNFDVMDIIEGDSFDLFWKAAGVDFVRLRENTRELTVKVTDKGTVNDRIEENTVVDELDATERIQTLLFGPSCLRISKSYTVFYVTFSPAPGTEFDAVISLYNVKGDPEGRTFLEVEAASMLIVDQVLEVLHPHLILSPENRSLFQIFSKGAL